MKKWWGRHKYEVGMFVAFSFCVLGLCISLNYLVSGLEQASQNGGLKKVVEDIWYGTNKVTEAGQ